MNLLPHTFHKRRGIRAMERKGETVPLSLSARHGELDRAYGRLCEELRNNLDAWLPESEQERYRGQNAELQKHFNTFALVPAGHVLARAYLESSEPFSYERLGRETETHLARLAARGNKRAAELIGTIDGIKNAKFLDLDGAPRDEQIRADIRRLAPYLAILPKPDLAVQHVIMYAKDPEFIQRAQSKGSNGDGIDTYTLSTGVRRHLYENVLYDVNAGPKRVLMPERYPAKV